QCGENTFYVECPAKMGIYRVSPEEVVLIDTGSDKDAGRRLRKILDENGWRPRAIINTHLHADHTGGNAFIQGRFECMAYSAAPERGFIENPVFEPALLYGGFPAKPLRNKFLMAQPSKVLPVENAPKELFGGLEFLRTDGHSIAQLAVKTPDDVWFLADCVTNETILKKYHIFFIYDLAAHFKTLDKLEKLSGKLFVPSHAAPTEDIRPLVKLNRDKCIEIKDKLLEICKEPIGFEDILKSIFDGYELAMDINQYVLVGSTLRSYLSYLLDEGKAETLFKENKLFWKAL
ncbi:MAG: MBL fold metallo-hydrolase, partial [Firmicutes bacterium]|nr:MBL fold metallo-hydrolase [Bacillota bacterium]